MSIFPQIIAPVTSPAGIMDIAREVQALQTGQVIRTQSIVGGQLANGTITATEIAAGTITATLIAAGTITATQIAAGTITAGNIAANTITAAQIAAGTITATQIAANTITATQIAATTITAGQIAANTITAAQIAAGTITTTQIAATTITAGNIAANTITAAQIATGTITGSLIAGGTITGANIAASTITASLLSVSNLAAVSANMGTVTGGIFQTATTGARVMMGTSMTTPSGVTAGIVGIDTGSNVTFSIDAATGNVVLKGTILTGSSGLGNIGGVTQNAVLSIVGGNLVSNPNVNSATVTSYTGTNATPAQDTAVFLLGPASLKATIGTTAAYSIAAGGAAGVGMSVTPASIYSGSAFIQTPSARAITVQIAWYNGSGTLISTTAASTFTSLAGQWMRVNQDNQTAPALAATALLIVGGTGHAASEVHNYDEFLFVNQPTAVGSSIVANSITAAQIAAGTITATQLGAVAITAGNITVGGIAAGSLVAGSILASNINATTLSAISGNLGTIVSGTITGGTIQTAATGARTVLDSTGLFATDSGGSNKTIGLDQTEGLSLILGGGALSGITWYKTTIVSGALTGAITCSYPAFSTDPAIGLEAFSTTTGAGLSSVSCLTDSATDAGNSVVARANGPAGHDASVVLIDGALNSDFVLSGPTIGAATSHNLLCGLASFVGGGGTPQTITLTHNVGRVPTAILCTPYGWLGEMCPSGATLSTTQASVTAWFNGGIFTSGVTYYYMWMAMT